MVSKTVQDLRGVFVAKFSKMGDKVIMIVPTDHHKDVNKALGKHVKVSWEEVI